MKRLTVSLLMVFALVLNTACSKDDDNGDGGSTPQNQLVATIDGVTKTFDTVVANNQFELTTVTASIGNSTSEIINIVTNGGETGSDVVWNFTYTLNGRVYDSFNSDGSFQPFVSGVITTNNGSNFTANFSALLGSYNNDTEMYESISIENGSVNVDY